MRKFLLFIVVSVLFLGCQSEPDTIKLLDDLVVATNYNPGIDFSSYNTYAIPTDTIGFFSNNSNDTIIVQSAQVDYPRPVINKIKEHLNGFGYTQVDKTQNPDLGISIVVVNDFDIFQEVIYPGYYGGGYYSGYYGYNSWYYYPYVNTYAYNTGVLIIEIVDLKNRTPDNKVAVIWDAYLGDVYSTIDLLQQTKDAIDQAFVQSPYLGK